LTHVKVVVSEPLVVTGAPRTKSHDTRSYISTMIRQSLALAAYRVQLPSISIESIAYNFLPKVLYFLAKS
jgi:hypothetical protein